MLEVKNLTKVYSGKGGVSVRALDNVSVTFPEKGMVFLLGKSGSGKSTLLNVAGGLDKPDGGEVIVKGKSSKEFSGSDFDSYRNTFIGFVFQEYNILNEFTIEQNISLALQLQNKPNNKAAVDALLRQVDLAGYGKRKPNTLSGGQKQRVAIARALIKEPEIIMADEPTGALDSTTGKQVFDTLKKLSETKLVIVVSHDRDFAETYGDRIIELKDGKILSDVEKVLCEPQISTENVSLVSEDTITVKNAEELTDEDLKQIAAMLKKTGGEAVITAGKRELPEVKRVCRINDNGSRETFQETGPVEIETYDGTKTKFIKSHLPLGHAIKMGASGLKSKPIRLIFTIILAVAAFVLFGVVSTFMLYDPDYSISEAMKEAAYPSITLDKQYAYTRTYMQINNKTGEETVDDTYDGTSYTLFGESEVAAKSKNGLDFAGVFTMIESSYNNRSDFRLSYIKDGNAMSISVKSDLEEYYCVNYAAGFTDCGKEYLLRNGFTIEGEYPKDATEIMMSEYYAQLFVNTESFNITRTSDLIGKRVRLTGNGFNSMDDFTVSGIVKTGEIPSKYDELKKGGNSNLNSREREALGSSLQDYLAHNFATLFYVSDDFYDTYSGRIQKENNGPYINPKYISNLLIKTDKINEYDTIPEYSNGFYTDKILEKYGKTIKVLNLDGTVKTTYTLGDDEVYLSQNRYNDLLRNYIYSHTFDPKYDAAAYAELGSTYSTAKENLYGDTSAMQIVIDASKKWYSKLGYRAALYENVWMLSNKTNDKYNLMYNYGLGEDGQRFLTGFNDHLYTSSTKDDWTLLQGYVDENLQVYYGLIATHMMDYYGWTDKFIEPSEDPSAVLAALRSGSYSATDFATKKAKIDSWLTELGYSADIHNFFSFDSSKGGEHVFMYCLTQQEKTFRTIYAKISTYVNSSASDKGGEMPPAPTDEDWEALEGVIKEYPQIYYSLLLNWINNNYYGEIFNKEEDGEDFWTVLDSLRYESYSASDFLAKKNVINAWFAAKGLTPELKTLFVFDISKAFDKVYYLDKNGNHGELKIAGYIESSNGGSEYCVTEAFLSAHGSQPQDSSEYSWFEVQTTTYAAPVDAKYNKLISLTDIHSAGEERGRCRLLQDRQSRCG